MQGHSGWWGWLEPVGWPRLCAEGGEKRQAWGDEKGPRALRQPVKAVGTGVEGAEQRAGKATEKRRKGIREEKMNEKAAC